MANSYTVKVVQNCDAVINLDSGVFPALTERSLVLGGFSYANTFSSDEVSFVYANKFTTNQTLDLSNLTDPISGTKDLTGKSVLAVIIVNFSDTNTLSVGGTFPLFGGTVSLSPGGRFLAVRPTNVTVSSTQKTISFSGSSDYAVMLVFGA